VLGSISIRTKMYHNYVYSIQKNINYYIESLFCTKHNHTQSFATYAEYNPLTPFFRQLDSYETSVIFAVSSLKLTTAVKIQYSKKQRLLFRRRICSVLISTEEIRTVQNCEGSEVLTAVLMKSCIFGNITSFRPLK
jgi:hypothetical protein